MLLADEPFCEVRWPSAANNKQVHLQVEPEKVYHDEATLRRQWGLQQTLSFHDAMLYTSIFFIREFYLENTFTFF